MSSSQAAQLRVQVTSDGDPSVVARLLGYFQNVNVTPKRIYAEFADPELMHLCVDVSDASEGCVSRITAKIEQHPCVHSASWERLPLSVPGQ